MPFEISMKSNFGGSVQVKADNWNKILSNTDFLSGLQEDLGEVEKNLGKEKLDGLLVKI